MHFYAKTKTGEVKPRHFVPMAKDPSRTRPSRVTDAKKAAKDGEVWYPSVTTVLNILDKPALLNWKVDQHLKQAFDLPAIPTLDEYLQVVKSRTREEMDKAPQAGTDIHNELEHGLFRPYYESDARNIITNVENVITGNIDMEREGYTCEKYFVDEVLGYAGCADLVLTGQDNWVIDYKTKQTADKFKPGKMQYVDHIRQLAAYGNALFQDGFRAANIFICIETGEVDFCEVPQDKLQNGYYDFLDCLSIHRRNVYQPPAAELFEGTLDQLNGIGLK